MFALSPKLTPPLAAHDCEIPAYAGMVLWVNGELWADLALLAAATIGGFGDNVVFADGFPSSPGPFQQRQESHSDVFALSPKLSGVAAC